MTSLKKLVFNRYFVIFILLWLVSSYGLTRYEAERKLFSQFLVSLFYVAQFLLIFFFVKPAAACASPEAGKSADNAIPGETALPGRSQSSGCPVKNARRETLFLLAAYFIYMAIQLTLLRQKYLDGRTFEVMRIYWGSYAVIPALYFYYLGYKPSDLGITAVGFKKALRSAAYAALIVIPFLLVASNSAMFIWKGHLPIAKLLLGLVVAVTYGFFSAGFFEEFFFRALLQTRLESLFSSEAGGLFLSSIL
ncbi:MAG: hypothetical protein Q7R35_15345, partial [Elusimicrobiota bacterium]|nr:hypothetical protein [Elusimicrobiota bacterium]